MIFYLATRRHTYTMTRFLETWGRELASRIQIMPYEGLRWATSLPAGTYIFSDVERLDPPDRDLAAQVWERLSGRPGVRLLNHPVRTLRRYELLRTLHERGLNRFNVHLLRDRPAKVRFPVFLRGADDHKGPQTPLLHTQGELAAAARNLRRGKRWLIVEFCDTSEAPGIWRKYSAFMVGGAVVTRHLFFSRDWLQKYPDLSEPWMVREERDYLDGNPHQVQLREIFGLAAVDYGRIDYGLLEGALQVWEINTNPTIMSARAARMTARLANNDDALARLRAALRAIDGPDDSPRVPLSLRGRLSPLRRLHVALRHLRRL